MRRWSSKVHPGEWTRANIATMRGQLKLLGLALDWSREFATCDPAYYGHEQALFVDLFEAGLVYRKESEVNWDPVDLTVLANEQVIDGRGWRSGALVERRKLSQWFLKITDFAEELLDGLEALDQWPDKVRLMQENWIGKSRGMKFRFRIADPRPAHRSDRGLHDPAGHDLRRQLRRASRPIIRSRWRWPAERPEVAAFIAECKQGGTTAAELETAEKLGFDTGLKVVHPFDPEWLLPVYIANFVLMDYGTGAIFGSAAHDQRDLDFARKYGLPVLRVVAPSPEEAGEPVGDEADLRGGVIVNSRFLDGMSVEAAIAEVIARAEAEGWGEGTTVWRLRDWGVSRQRYWGTPIPIVHCAACGAVPVPKDQLPVVLPEDIDFETPGQSARPASDAGSMSPARNAAARRCARPTRSTRSSIPPGISSASPASRRTGRSTRRRPSAGCRWISISAASSMRSCTCSTRASGPGRCSGSACSTWPSRSRACSRKGWSPTSPIGTRTATGCCRKRRKRR